MKQRSIRDYTGSPLQDYNIVSTEWLGKSKNQSPISTKPKTRLYKSRSQKSIKSPSRKSTAETSPFGKWIQHTNNAHSHKENKYGKNTSTLTTNQTTEMKSCESPDVDEILENINMLKEEAKLLEDFHIICRDDESTPTSLKKIVDSNEKVSSTKDIKKHSHTPKSRNKYKTRKGKSQSQEPTTQVRSPLDIWLQRKHSDHETKRKRGSEVKPFKKSDSFEKYGVILPTVDDILKNMDTMKEERRLLDNYDDLFEESDVSIPSSLKVLLDSPEKISTIPLLTCEHLSKSDLKIYCAKYMNYLKNISEGLEFSKRHQTYQDHNSRSKLTYSFTTVVFTESQLEYLMKKIEKALDPEEKHTEYLFMVILPELCLKICMDEFDMSNEEVVDYLNQRPID